MLIQFERHSAKLSYRSFPTLKAEAEERLKLSVGYRLLPQTPACPPNAERDGTPNNFTTAAACRRSGPG
jgi:hypothetical protein